MLNQRLLSLVLAAGLILGMTSLAMAGVPDAGNSQVEFIYNGPYGAGDLITTSEPGLAGCNRGVTIYPDGTGPSLVQRQCDMVLWVRDANTLPIPGYPAQDIWTDDAGDASIALCQGGSVADADTDNDGRTTISGVVSGGGTNPNGMAVYVSGVALTLLSDGTGGIAMDFWVNSPDINGDLSIDLSDISLFTVDLSTYNYRSDYNWDGLVDLSDISLFANAIDTFCP